MKDIITNNFIIKLVEVEYNSEIICPKDCFRLEKNYNNRYKCTYISKFYDGKEIDKLNIFKLVAKNISDNTFCLNDCDFHIIDSNGFSYDCEFICDDTLIDRKYKTLKVEVPSNSQVRFRIITKEFEDDATLSRIEFNDNKWFSLEVSDNQIDIVTSDESLMLEKIKLYNGNKNFQDENEKNTRIPVENSINFETVEDDDYVYLISKETSYSISFHRQFNTNQSNYNWVEVGNPLISLHLDEYSLSFIPTRVLSPATGIFEFDKKQFIKTGEVICRIRKYSIEEKEELFLGLEKQAIKNEVFRKERKKKLEREALDELISEGLVFNSYIDKYGNRSKISCDVSNAVWNRDGGKCCECGSKENLEFDHIIPVSRGGATTYHNLQILCKTCNIKKSNKIGNE